MKLVLDTNVYCDYAEGLPATVEFVAEFGDEILMPAIVVGELIYGFMKGTRRELNEKKLWTVIRKLEIDIITVNPDVARKYAIIYLSLVNKGRKIPINDVWVAACCMHVGGVLLTRDKHFKAVDHIESIVIDS
jgi:tRNA(fMet)-specific endonuclease VapC